MSAPKLRRCVLVIKRIVLIETMNAVHLRELDLNLLVLLRDLLETKSTVKTAKRSGRTQSAVSHGLSRLRVMFDDQLLVRVGGGLSLTAFAEELVDPLHRLLLDTQRLVSAPRSLDPVRLQRTFTLGCTDYAEIVLVPTLMQRLRKEAPMATLVTRALGADAEAALIAREVDLAYGTRFKQLGAIVEEPLQRESMRVLLRCGHPALARRLTRKAYAALDHVLVTPRGSPGGSVDTALAPFGLERRVVLRLPNFVSAALIVAQTDFVVTLPQGFAQRMTEVAKLESLPAPVPIADFTFKMAYSRTLEADPVHRWFRALFSEAVRTSVRGP